MSNQNNGGPAFAASGHPEQQFVQQEGMTLRDYFAAKAISILEPPVDYVGAEETSESYQEWASKAYKMADAMLRAREE